MEGAQSQTSADLQASARSNLGRQSLPMADVGWHAVRDSIDDRDMMRRAHLTILQDHWLYRHPRQEGACPEGQQVTPVGGCPLHATDMLTESKLK